MLAQILTKTPLWVWLLLAGLVALGLSQSRTRVIHLKRVIILPLVMTGLSLAGVLSAFGAGALIVWLLAAALATLLMTRIWGPGQARFDAYRRQFTVPGSWVPMAMMLGIFVTKYAVGVASAMQPQWPHDPLFASAFSALYGIFSGVFLARAIGLLKLAAVWPTAKTAVFTG